MDYRTLKGGSIWEIKPSFKRPWNLRDGLSGLNILCPRLLG